MTTVSATDVRKNWSMTLDTVVREKPVYVRRVRDNVAIINQSTLDDVLSFFDFSAHKYIEDDGSLTLSSVDLDLAVNAPDEESARNALAKEIKEYAEDFYNDFALWSKAPNRKKHVPLVLKALTLNKSEIAEEIICLDGKN